MEEEIPGKRVESNFSLIISASVKSARLVRKISRRVGLSGMRNFSDHSHFTGVGTLVGDNDCLQGRVISDIPYMFIECQTSWAMLHGS